MRFTSACVVLALAACNETADPAPMNIEGLWNYTEVLEDKLRGVSCSDTGAYRLRQVGDRFEGEYFQRGVCHVSGGGFFNTDSGFVSAGVVVGNTLRFNATPTCQYEGRLSETPERAIAGKGFCTIQLGGLQHNFEGSWRALHQR
jgi:hypothetical protein